MSDPTVNLEAYASGSGTIYMAAGDQYLTVRDVHVHHGDGQHRIRRIDSGTDGGDECPYPGMSAFGAAQSKWFFGRDQTLGRLTRRLDECLQDGGAVVVVAASGAGKSSLLQAGLVPALARGALPGSRRWPCLVFTPGAHPVAALARHLAALTDGEPDEIERELSDDTEALADRLGAALAAQRADRLVVIVDQAEELFTQAAAENRRKGFVSALERLAEARMSGSDGPLALVVYGVRADFYARFAQYRPLREALEHRQVFVGPMSRTELREAILFPAQREGLELEEGLVELLLSDLGSTTPLPSQSAGDESLLERGYEAGRLPLLAHALRVTWQQRHGAILTVDGYRASGRIQGAVAETAEDAYRQLAAAGRQGAEVMFRRLVRIGEGTDDTRRARTERELTEGLDPAAAEAVLAGFTRGRLLTRLRDTVQITHEALLHAWPRLRSWIDTDRADNLLRQKLEEAAAAWDRTPRRDPDLLYRGSQLDAARGWADRTGRAGLGPTAAAFLDASLNRSRRSTVIRRAAGTALVTLTVIALVAAQLAFNQQRLADQRSREATAERNLATERLLLADARQVQATDPELSLQLSLAALRLNPTQEGRTALLATLQQTALDGGSVPGAVGAHVDVAAVSGDDTMVAVTQWSTAEATTVHLWDTTDIAHPRPLATLHDHVNPVRAVVFSPDQRLLVTMAAPDTRQGGTPADNDVILWDLSDRQQPRKLPFRADAGDPVRGAAFSPDGRRLALLAGDGATGTLTLWDLGDGTAPRRLSDPVAASQAEYATFSADGRTLVTSSGAIVAKDDSLTPDSITHRTGWQVWDVSDPAHPRATAAQPFINGAAAFSPDGPLLATAYERSVFLWDLSNPSAPRKLATLNDSDSVNALALGPHGLLIASGLDGISRLWDVTDPAHPQARPALVGAHGATSAASSDLDQGTRSGHFSPIEAVAFSRDAQRVWTVDDSGTLARWLVNSRNGPTLFGSLAAGGSLTTEAFSPDGRLLVTGGFAGDARLWDTADPSHPRELAQLPGRSGWRVEAVGVNRAGTVVAVGTAAGEISDKGEVTLWDVSNPGQPRKLVTLTGQSGVGSLAFSPRSDLLAVTGGEFFRDSWVGLWDTSNPTAPVQQTLITSLRPRISSKFQGDTVIHTPTLFSPDGRRLALPDSLWDVSKPAAPVLVPVRQPANMFAPGAHPWIGTSIAAFRPDGKVLAARNTDGGVDLWSLGDAIGPTQLSTVPLASDVAHLAYHPDGNLLAVAHANGVVDLYETADPATPGLMASLPDTGSDVADVQFGPDRRSLAVVREDGTVQLWDLAALPAIAADVTGLACRLAGGGLSREDWTVTYHLNQPYQDTCSRG
ncbi:WD40 repeat domain-containing protein [Kitasatospora kifunensis]|uniref:WD40 repeat protein n=1 Tax=Kitasatospora kifunensis TaxID=58351 RepID=A0A7W7QY33_KITKI|nr:WD40 repeat domain-containing protein [Kitasatospora kifunensis]MBB4921917.1 WD40 repeat protein [Kitasatospora kifunensis]